MKNKLSDLNNYLFEQLERLNDDDLQGDELQQEIKRVEQIVDVSEKIITNADLQLKATKLAHDIGSADLRVPQLLLGE